MEMRTIGRTGLKISVLSFGAGPVAGLMTGDDQQQQRATVAAALESGINWFDTAPGYGYGRSEQNLGRVLRELDALDRCHLATKVRLTPPQLADIPAAVRSSVRDSLTRLGVSRLTLLQLHNSITAQRDNQPSSITPEDVLGLGGVLDAFHQLRREGVVSQIGLTGTGDVAALREVIDAGVIATIQVPYHLLLADDPEVNRLIDDCVAAGVSVLAMRVFAGGALLDLDPSPYTLITPYFPLDQYQRDRARAQEMVATLDGARTLKERALRFVLHDSRITSAIIGLASPDQVREVARMAQA